MTRNILILIPFIPIATAVASIEYLSGGGSLRLVFNNTSTKDIVYEGMPNSLIEGNDGGINWGGLGNGFVDAVFDLVNIDGPEIFVYEAQSGLPEFDFRVLVADKVSAFSESDFDEITSSYSGAFKTINDSSFDSNYIYSFDIASVGYEVKRIRIVGIALTPPGETMSEGNGFELDTFAVVTDPGSVIPEPSYVFLCAIIGAFVAYRRRRG